MRGQPLVFLATVVALWVSARILHHHLPLDAMSAPDPLIVADRSDIAVTSISARPLQQQTGMMALLGLEAQAPVRGRLPRASAARIAAQPSRDPMPVDLALMHQRLWVESLLASGAAGGRRSALVDRPIALDGDAAAPVQPVTAAAGKAASSAATTQRRWSVYGWSLIREASQPPALAAGGQYGGSQAGLVVRLALGGAGTSPAAYVRATAALASADDRSLAFGVSARPWPQVPVELAVERRLGLGRGQRDQFAAMLIGGMTVADPQSKVRLDGFVQAGVIGIEQSRGFFDLQMLASRPVARTDDHALSVGGGLWAGGQQNIDADGTRRWLHRVDLGPRATVDLPLGEGRVTLAVDWRHRVDGDASPVSGAAVTLAAGF